MRGFGMNKKSWLDYLFYKIGAQEYDYYLCGLKKLSDGTVKSTKWKKYSECVFPIDFDGTCNDWKTKKFFKQINQRQILPNEVVLDLETEENITKIIRELKTFGCPFYVFSTQSKGSHISLFMKEELTEKEKFQIIKYFGADEQKASKKTMIALEYVPHWKSNKEKIEVFRYDGN